MVSLVVLRIIVVRVLLVSHERLEAVPGADRTFMREPVIGLAFVDYPAHGGVHAYISRAGTDATPVPATLLGTIRGYLNAIPGFPQPIPATNMHFVDTITPATITDLRAMYGQLELVAGGGVAGTLVDWPADAVGKAAEQARGGAWAAAGGASPAERAIISYIVGPNFVHKRWYSAGDGTPANPAGWKYDYGTVGGTCALSKLITSLKGLGQALPTAPPPAAAAPLPALGVGGAQLICAAEAAHRRPIGVKGWSGANKQYLKQQEVASCAACQSVMPELVSGNFATWRANCIVPPPPLIQGNRGNCPANGFLPLRGTCTFTCNVPYYVNGPAITCSALGVRSALQTCIPKCVRPGPIVLPPAVSANHRGSCAQLQLGGVGGGVPCRYTCPPGFRVTGDDMTCNHLGVSSPEQTCVAIHDALWNPSTNPQSLSHPPPQTKIVSNGREAIPRPSYPLLVRVVPPPKPAQQPVGSVPWNSSTKVARKLFRRVGSRPLEP